MPDIRSAGEQSDWGDVAILDNGNIVVIVNDRSGLREASNSTAAVILAPDGSVVRESWGIDPRDIGRTFLLTKAVLRSCA
ncbi:MAG: hypothetical protein M2R45_04676 [Verrucomicrobia subdivision 3 bacterium]|nr:hypothetical protein [Limisphaerales bacterium]MCS1416599.1 hypothetical protein [Limisphaerales bacterium]